MKPNRLTFAVSLVVIMLISWADIRFFGFEKTYYLSPLVRQAGHYTIFTITAAIGYYNWKDNEKWLRWLWVALYVGVFVFAISISVAYNLTGHLMAKRWKIVMAEVRLTFMGPLPFLVFYLFTALTKQLTGIGKTAKPADH